jgi:hypothetical protein
MGGVGLDRTRPLTGEHAGAPEWCGRPATCSSAMGPAPCACSFGGEGCLKENGNTRVVVISRWRTLEWRSQLMLLNTERRQK